MSTTIESSPRAAARAQFPPHTDLRREMVRRVDAYFEERGLDEKGDGRSAFKCAVMVTWLVASYVLLVFFATTWWMAAPLAISLGLAAAGIGFSVMHDGGHGAASRRPWLNRLAASSNDFLGASSYMWNQKHNIIHHTYTNVNGLEEDSDAQPFLRLHPSQRRRWYQRFQHLYELFLLVFFVPKWAFIDDWQSWITGRISAHTIQRPRGWDAVQLVLGKVFFYGWAVALPLALHSPLHVVLAFVTATTVLGITLGMVFQLAHIVEGTEFATPPADGEPFERSFFEHQIATTSDFAPRNALVTWYVGGLNFQVEHHLFPRISHRHYPALAGIVQDVCREQGVVYHSHDTVTQALRSHFRYLRRLGRAA